MTRAKLILLFVLILTIIRFSYSFASTQIYDSNLENRIRRGIDYIYNIQFDSAEVVFKRIMLDYPQNPAGRFFLAMIDWWKIAIDPDNRSLDELFFEKLEDVIYHCDQILKKDEKNLDAIFLKVVQLVLEEG